MKHLTDYISKHLLVVTTLAYISGVASAPLLYWPDQDISLMKLSLIVFLVFSLLLHLLKKPNLLLLLLLPLMFSLGCYHTATQLNTPMDGDHIFHMITKKSDVVLVGTMANMAAYNGRTSVVTIQTQHIRYNKRSDLLPTRGKVLLRLQGRWPDKLAPGDTLAIRSDLKRPVSYRSPGSFDYAQYLARKDIWATGFVHSPSLIQKVSQDQSLLHRLHYWPERVRSKIAQQLDAVLSPEQSGVYRAILIGDRSGINEDILESFKGSGTFHILAISGLHMTVIGTLLFLFFYFLLSRSEYLLLRFTLKKWALLFSLPIMLGYGLLAGMNAPVFRAVLMSSIIVLAICTNRRKSPGPLLASAALFILLLNPLQLFSVSFQLSFAAITGILFLLPSVVKLLNLDPGPSTTVPLYKRSLQRIVALLLVSIVANLATLPIALSTFNRFSTVGPIANIVIEPLLCLWTLAAGFLALPFVFIAPEVSSYLFQFGGLGLDLSLKATTFFSSFSFATIRLPNPPAWLLIIYYVSMFFFISRGFRSHRYTLVAAFSFVVCLVLLFKPIYKNLTPSKPVFRLSFLDVGQGTATLLDFPNSSKILIDGGGSSFSSTTVGDRIIAPYLWYRGIAKLDAIAVTHPDADHYNGLPTIVKYFKPNSLWIRDITGHKENFQQLLTLAKTQGVTVTPGQRGQLWQENNNYLECIENTLRYIDGDMGRERDILQTTRDRENSGLVLKACYNSFCALFPGDIGRAVEKILVEKEDDLRAAILLAAHHGSNTSNSVAFLQAVKPDYLVVSAGRSSRGYFPHPGLQEDCDSQQISLFNTAEQGTLEVIVAEDSYHIYGYQRTVQDNPLSPLQPLLLHQQQLD